MRGNDYVGHAPKGWGIVMENGYDWRELDALPTLAVGQADDLKIDNGDGVRVWLSRVTRADGEHCDHHVSVERFDGDRWVTVAG